MKQVSVIILPLVLFAGCGGEAVVTPEHEIAREQELAEERALAGQSGQVTLPEGVPVPEEYRVLGDREVAGARFVILEITGDLGETVERFNEELAASPHEADPFHVGRDQEGLSHATTTVRMPDSRIALTISEYGEEGGLQEGSTGSITYHITRR